jgi:enoyl-CoA hydratase/carnithine racemase
MSDSVTVEYNGKIAVITIDNQKKLNALNQDEYYLLAKYMREVATHDEVFVTVLTGKGMLSIHKKITANCFQVDSSLRKLQGL